MSTPASPPGDSSRDGQGHFLPNNPGGPGNPFGRQVALLRKALIAGVSPEDFTAIAGKLKDKALAGDLAAMKLLFSYVLGKPTPMPDPDEVENKQFKEQEKLETAIGRIVLPIIRRGAFEDEQPPPPGPSVATGSAARPTVNKPAAGTSPTPQRPQDRAPAMPQTPPAVPQAPSGGSGQQSVSRPRSTNGPVSNPSAASGTTGKNSVSGPPTAKLADLLADEDAPFRPGCEQTGLTIVSS